MIRDPSDGSVKVGHHPKPLEPQAISSESDVLVSTTSGLPKHKREELKRLNESREWIKNYFHRKAD